MAKELTTRQKQVLDFIVAYQETHGYPPTVREVAGNFGFKSPRAAHDHMKALERKGQLRTLPGKPRAMEILAAKPGIPVLGRIAAGEPILAVEEADEHLGFEPEYFGHGEMFALRVSGQSMIGDYIDDGDLVIIRSQENALPGEIIAALVEDEVTLKRFHPKGDRVLLAASNPMVADIIVRPADGHFRILGVMAGLVRRH